MLDWIVVGFSGVAVGSVLGLVGAGGAMVAIPILTHLLGYSQAQAMSASLLIVLIAAASGAWRGWQKREASIPHAIVYGSVGALFAWGAARIAPGITEDARSAGFICVLLAASFFMIRPARVAASGAAPESRTSLFRLFLREGPYAAFIGTLSGIFGVGGGFLLVPILHLKSRLSFSRTVATSLVAIIANGVFGFLGALPFLLASGLRWGPILGIAAIAFCFSQWIAVRRARFDERLLRRGFAGMLWALAALELWRLYART